MTITVNGQSRSLPAPMTLAQFLQGELAPGRDFRGTAAAIDGEVVPRTLWAQWQLLPGQALELVTAVQGG